MMNWFLTCFGLWSSGILDFLSVSCLVARLCLGCLDVVVLVLKVGVLFVFVFSLTRWPLVNSFLLLFSRSRFGVWSFLCGFCALSSSFWLLGPTYFDPSSGMIWWFAPLTAWCGAKSLERVHPRKPSTSSTSISNSKEVSRSESL